MTMIAGTATSADVREPRSRCLACGVAFVAGEACSVCGGEYEFADGIAKAIGRLSGRNRVAAAFYDGAGWRRFRPWEHLFLFFQGGGVSARRQALHRLAPMSGGRLLDVGIGDGECLSAVPRRCEVWGVDIAPTRLCGCLAAHPSTRNRLWYAEVERLPFDDHQFDAAYTVGGFNYFSDHRAALREMVRVVKPGGVVIVADELPDLRRFALGHFLGLDGLDALALRLMGLDAEFTAMALACRLKPRALFAEALPGSTLHPIWNRLGYCVTYTVPENVSAAGRPGSASPCR